MAAKNLPKGFKFIKNNDDMIFRDVKEYFEEPNIYLKQINKIIVGKELLKKYEKRINGIDDEDKKEISKEISNINKLRKSRRNTARKSTIDNHIYFMTEGNEKRPSSVGIHYQYKTTKEILNQYKEGRKREIKEKEKGTNNLIPKNVMEKVKNQYINQEKQLKRLILESNNDEMFIGHLSKKCKIKRENLLFNTIENFRIKNQLINYIEYNKNLYEKFGNYCWYMNLRRPKIMNKSKGNFLNIGKVENNIWEPVVDLPDKKIEIIKKAEKSYEAKNNYENFFNEKYIKTYKNINKKIKKNRLAKLSDINNIIIKGKNIISFEKENFLKYENKNNIYRVFKDPREENLRYCKDCIYKTNYKMNSIKNNIEKIKK
jgi:hypothetical protein